MKRCKNCNLSYEDTVAFCPKCGTTLEDTELLETTESTETTESGETVREKPVKKYGNILPVIALICSVFSVQCWCMFGYVFTTLAAIAVILSAIALVKKIGSKGIAIAAMGIAIMGVLINILLIYAYNQLDDDTAFSDTFKTFWGASWSWPDDSYEELLHGDFYEEFYEDM